MSEYIFIISILFSVGAGGSRMPSNNDDKEQHRYIPEGELKSEIQTQSGFLKEIKDLWVPDTSEMGELALEKYEEENGSLSDSEIRENFNEILKELFKLETQIYNEKEDQFIQNLMKDFIQDYYQDSDADSYPSTQELLEQLEHLYEESDSFEQFFSKSFPRIYPLAGPVYYSASQGRKTRVGNTLENHLETLLRRLDYPVETQVQLSGARIDLVLPNEDTFREEPSKAIFLACQTTLKDRFRLSLSKLPSDGKYDEVSKFITTATGINLVTDSDESDITEGKIQESLDHGYKLLVFDGVKEEYPDNEGVVSYSQFARDILPKDADSWDVVRQGEIDEF